MAKHMEIHLYTYKHTRTRTRFSSLPLDLCTISLPPANLVIVYQGGTADNVNCNPRGIANVGKQGDGTRDERMVLWASRLSVLPPFILPWYLFCREFSGWCSPFVNVVSRFAGVVSFFEILPSRPSWEGEIIRNPFSTHRGSKLAHSFSRPAGIPSLCLYEVGRKNSHSASCPVVPVGHNLLLARDDRQRRRNPSGSLRHPVEHGRVGRKQTER